MNSVNTNTIQQVSFAVKLQSYVQLTKIKLTTFVTISAVFGYFIGAASYSVVDIIVLTIGGFLITGASNAYNQVIERNFDKLMKRTQNRPMPLGKLSVTEAVFMASIWTVLGVSLLWVFLNPLSGILASLAIFLYVAVYTPLKRISPISVFVGAFPGAFPPMLGWVAATGAFSLEAGILFAIQFVWQFPHFWAIAWKVNDDYKNAGFKMLPFGKKNKLTAYIILASTVALLLSGFLPQLVNFTGYIATIGLTILSIIILIPSIKLVKTLDDKYALKIMLMSYLYLVGSLAIILIDKV